MVDIHIVFKQLIKGELFTKNQYDNYKIFNQFILDNYHRIKAIIRNFIDIKIPNKILPLIEKYHRKDFHLNPEENVRNIAEKKLIDLLTIIYQSDLIKDLSQALYCNNDKNMKYYFNKKDSVKEFWYKIILFIPFKLKRVSGFEYREFFKICISAYTICHFDSYLENEIFTLGSFFKTILHETIGHFLINFFPFTQI